MRFIDHQSIAMCTVLAGMAELRTVQTAMLSHRSMSMIEFTMVLFYSSAIDARINIIYDTA
jgi:hypothetical protein